MDRKTFLKNLAANKVKLTKVEGIENWEGDVFVRPQTIGELRDQLLREEPDNPRDALKTDQMYLARQLARIVRDENGALIFDADDEAQVKELMTAMEDVGPSFTRRINETYNRVNQPSLGQVTAEGNSPSAKSS